MAQRHTPAPEHSRAPVLLAPRQETVVDAGVVTFAWEPVQGAVSQRLEVAADHHFDRVLLEQDVTGKDSVKVENVFAAEGDTYFWRIIVEDADGQRHGEDVVESFVGGTAEEAVQHHTELTGGHETYGPVGELLKGAATEMAAEITHDEEYFRREVELGVAHEGIAAGQIFGITAAIVLALVLIIVTLIQYTQITAQEIRYSTVGISGYPERREVELSAQRRLTEYGVVDAEQGVYRIPIDRAIELMSNETYQQQQQGATYSSELPIGTNAATGQ